MTVQVLVVTMNQKQGDYSLLDKMNIQTDAIICNQCDQYEVNEFIYKDHKIIWMSFAERGVGLNRNNALMRATADLLLLADDDMVFENGYEQKVLYWAEKVNNADILLFNILKNNKSVNGTTKLKPVRKHNFGRYATPRFVLKNKSIKFSGIMFNTLFGGGTCYSCGEDSLFLSDCLKAKLRLYAIPDTLAELIETRDSTWFNGYTDKFFFDKGVLYYAMNKKACVLFSFYHCIKHRKRYSEYGWFNAWKQMYKGVKSVKR